MRPALLAVSFFAFACGTFPPPGGTGGGGGTTVRCNTGNCAGCCDSNDVCQLGQSEMACGTGGNACLSCGTGLKCSSATCVASSGTGGGSGGSGGGSATGGGGGSTGTKRLFMTSSSYTGNLKAAGGGATGLAGGDALCNLAAQAANVNGRWVAWLSAGSTRAFDRVTSTGPWLLMGTSTVVFNNKASLATTPIVAIDRNERGQLWTGQYWTGTSNGGGGTGTDCNAWEFTSNYGTYGDGDTEAVWTNASYTACSNMRALLCFEL